MLADGQDPTALEARLAFHLHRLQLTGEALRNALNGKMYLATALSQARMSVEPDFITELAANLSIAADELVRPLLEQESSEWRFYRTSASNREQVWANVAQFATANNLSRRALANIIGMKIADVSNSISGKRKKVLTLDHATKLAATQTPPLDPLSLLPPPDALERE